MIVICVMERERNNQGVKMLFAILGYVLTALPFVVLFIFGCKEIGWRQTLLAFGITAIVVVIATAAAYFLALAGVVQFR